MVNSETIRGFLNGLRIVIIDGTCLDIPDSDNARVFGRPGSCVKHCITLTEPYYIKDLCQLHNYRKNHVITLKVLLIKLNKLIPTKKKDKARNFCLSVFTDVGNFEDIK